MISVILAVLVAVCGALPQNNIYRESPSIDQFQPSPVQTLQDAGIIRMENTQNEDGSFRYGFETADGIVQDVSGETRTIGENVGVVMSGSYSYTTQDENGQPIRVEVKWVADENGFQPEGDGIPKLPEIPTNVDVPFQGNYVK